MWGAGEEHRTGGAAATQTVYNVQWCTVYNVHTGALFDRATYSKGALRKRHSTEGTLFAVNSKGLYLAMMVAYIYTKGAVYIYVA